MKAVIMAGGMGTRLKPVSGDTPKPMVPLCGRPVMEYVLLHLKKHGITELCAALKYRAEDIIGYFGDGSALGMKLSYRIETEALGTAGAVKSCEEHYGDEPLLVVSGDAICDLDLTAFIKEYERQRPSAAIALSPDPMPLRYGLALCDDDGYIRSFIEKPDWTHVVTNLINTGIYILSPEAMSYVPKGKPFDFAKDLFPKLLENGKKLLGVPLDGYWCDIGTPKSYYECCVDAISGKLELPIREDFVQMPEDEKSSGGKGCPCRDRARLMDTLSRCFLGLGGDFSDGLCFELGGKRFRIAPESGSCAIGVTALDGDSEFSRELVPMISRLISDTEKALANSDD